MSNLLKEQLADLIFEGIDAVHDVEMKYDAYAWSAAEKILESGVFEQIKAQARKEALEEAAQHIVKQTRSTLNGLSDEDADICAGTLRALAEKEGA